MTAGFNKKMQIAGFISNTQNSHSHLQMFRKCRGVKRKAVVNVLMLQLHQRDTSAVVQFTIFFPCRPDSSQVFRLCSFLSVFHELC